MERTVTIQTRVIFERGLLVRSDAIDTSVAETLPGTQQDFLFGPGGGDYIGINSYDARLVTSD